MKMLKPIISASVACLMATAAFGGENWKDHIIEYDYNNGTGTVKTEKYNPDTLPKTLEVAKRPGYKFLGWGLYTRRYHKKKDGKGIEDTFEDIIDLNKPDGGKKAQFYRGMSKDVFTLKKLAKNTFTWAKDGTDNNASKCKDYRDIEFNEKDGQLIPKDSVVNYGKIKAVAQWELIKYHLVLDPNGGNMSTDGYKKSNSTYVKDYTIHDGKFTLPKPEKTEHIFKGWCTDKAMTNCSMTVTLNSPSSDDTVPNKTYYAKWEGVPYEIELYTNGGQVAGSTWTQKEEGLYVGKYTIDSDFKLPTPFKGTTTAFAGWCTDSKLLKCSKTVNIKNKTGNKEYYAKWAKMDMKANADKLNKKINTQMQNIGVK